MAQRINNGADATLLVADLVADLGELFDLRDKIKTAAYAPASYAFTIDSSLRTLFGHDTAIVVAGTTASLQNHGISIAASSYAQAIWASGSSSGSRMFMAKSRSGTIGSHTAGIVQSGDTVMQFDGAGSDGVDFQPAARIFMAVDGTPGVGDMPGRIGLSTTSDGAATPTERLRIDSSGHTSPAADNTYTCGISARRWSVVYAATGTINTSDARDKTAVAPMTDAEVAAAKDLAREVGTFQFLDAVAKKGSAARKHAGLTVQRAMEVMRKHGLDPMAYGFICHDSWAATTEPAVTVQKPTGILDAQGRQAMSEVEVQPAKLIPGGDRYSFRPDELLMFIARGFEARLAALEAA